MAAPLSDAALLALADALADGAWHSGEDLAGLAGVTRAALAKRMDRLRELALDIEARQGLGYRLGAPLERLDAAALAAQAPVPVSVLPVTDSTNARLLAAEAQADPQALFAEFQSAGRGRRGRQWVSPFGANLYFSLAWSFAAWPRQLTCLPLVCGVACTRALRAAGLVDAALKWPNDLYAGDRKLGGILVEHRGEAGAGCRVVIGVGINVAMRPAQAGAIEQPWTTLEAELAGHHRAPPPRTALARILLESLVGAVRTFAQDGFAPFAADWAAFDLTQGRAVSVQLQDRVLHGQAAGVDDQGALIVEAEGQRHLLHSGEVSLRLR